MDGSTHSIARPSNQGQSVTAEHTHKYIHGFQIDDSNKCMCKPINHTLTYPVCSQHWFWQFKTAGEESREGNTKWAEVKHRRWRCDGEEWRKAWERSSERKVKVTYVCMGRHSNIKEHCADSGLIPSVCLFLLPKEKKNNKQARESKEGTITNQRAWR